MSELKSKIAFGSEKDIDKALEEGLINSYDLLLLDEHKIGWVDGDGEKVIVRSPQPDHDENDPNSENYIKNRLAYTETEFRTVLDSMSIVISESIGCAILSPSPFEIAADTEYMVTIDGHEHSCTSYPYNTGEGTVCHAIGSMPSSNVVSDLPFMFVFIPEELAPQFDLDTYDSILLMAIYNPENGVLDIGEHTVSVKEKVSHIHKIDTKYYDRLAYDYEETKTIISETVINITQDHFGEHGLYMSPSPIQLESGVEYELNIDGKSYRSITKDYVLDQNAVVLGNIELFNGEGNSGEPFLAAYNPPAYDRPDELAFCIIDPDSGDLIAGEHTLEVSLVTRGTKKIESKFYNDVLCYKKLQTNILTDYTIEDIMNADEIFPAKFVLESSKNYIVRIGNEEYKTSSMNIVVDGVRAVVAGNPFSLGFGDDNGLPFCILYADAPDAGDINVLFFKDHYGQTLDIFVEEEEDYCVDHKFLDIIDGGNIVCAKDIVFTRDEHDPNSNTFFSDDLYDSANLVPGAKVRVTINGVSFDSKVQFYSNGNITTRVIGDVKVQDYDADYDVPFAIMLDCPDGLNCTAAILIDPSRFNSDCSELYIDIEVLRDEKINTEYLYNIDWDDPNPESPGNIKNRPFAYDIMHYDISSVTPDENSFQISDGIWFVKLTDYVPTGDELFDIKINVVSGAITGEFTIKSSLLVDNEGDSWRLSMPSSNRVDDTPLVYGILDDSFDDTMCEFSKNGLGVYVFYCPSVFPMATINLPIRTVPAKKVLPPCEWAEIKNKPFGLDDGYTITTDDINQPLMYARSYITDDSEYGYREVDDAPVLYRCWPFPCGYDDMIGSVVYFKNGESYIISEPGIAEYENDMHWLLVCSNHSDLQTPKGIIYSCSNPMYHPVDIFVSGFDYAVRAVVSGIYVSEDIDRVVVPGKNKKLSLEYIEDTVVKIDLSDYGVDVIEAIMPVLTGSVPLVQANLAIGRTDDFWEELHTNLPIMLTQRINLTDSLEYFEIPAMKYTVDGFTNAVSATTTLMINNSLFRVDIFITESLVVVAASSALPPVYTDVSIEGA